MSLSDCIRKAGKALNGGDADAISALADEIESTGVDRVDAEKQAVEQHISNVQTEIDSLVDTTQLMQEAPAYKDAELVYNDLKNQFLDLMPEDADVEEVMDALDDFSPTQQRFLKALDRADWLGFDYPSQAISALLSGTEDLDAYDMPIGLKQAMGVMVNRARGYPDQFRQEGADTARGMIEIMENEHIIRLSNASDMSTFLHESLHMFVSMEGKFAKEYGLTANQQAMLDHVGAKSFDELTVDQHETLAESFEVYLREGRAPSLKLADAFAVIRSWLLRIYESVKMLPRQKLDDDLRQVFDRLLATEEEIKQAEASPAYQELFRSKEQAGMTDEEWEKYQETKEKRGQRALSTVQEKLVKQLRARKTKEWNSERKVLVEEEMERLAEEPVYKVLADTLKRTDNLTERPLDRESVKTLLGVKKLDIQWNMRTSTDGSDLDMVAEAQGFPDGKTMIKAMSEAPSLKKAATEVAEARMIEKYGDILNDGSIESEVQAALHNDQQASLLLKEISQLSRQPKIDRNLLKAEARRLIGTMKNSEIRPNKFYRNEVKAAQKAAKATSPEEKLRAKQQQLANHYLYKEALKVKADLAKWRKHIDYVRTRAESQKYNTNLIDLGHVQQMGLMAQMYRSRKDATPANIEKALAFYDAQRDAVNDLATLQDPQLLMYVHAKEKVANAETAAEREQALAELNSFKFKVFEDLTVDEMRGAYHTLRNLQWAGTKLKESNVDFERKANDLAESILNNGGGDFATYDAKPAGEELKKDARKYVGMLPSLRNLIRKLDGFNEDGVAYDLLFRKTEEGNNAKLTLSRDLYDRYEALLNDIDNVALTKFGNETITKENGDDFTLHSEGRFMLALYWGTESSREAIRQGHGVTDNDVMRMLQKMTPDELKLVNAVWEMNESMWPDVSKAHVERYGFAPPKLDPTPFMVNGQMLSGGHMQIFYDNQVMDYDDSLEGEFNHVNAGRAGSMIARVGSGGRKIDLSKSNIARSMNDVIHSTAFLNPSRDLAALLRNKGVKNAIIQKHGEDFFNTLVKTLRNITNAKHDRDSNATIAKVVKAFRRAATYKYLMYSVRNIMQQPTALLPAVREVGFANWANAATTFLDPAQFRQRMEFVQSQSPFMKNRASLVNREATEYLQQITIGGKAERTWKWLVDHGFTAQTFVDSLIAYPTWLAKYESELARHGDAGKAASAADTAVAESVGSGSDLHLGGGFQSTNNELVKGVTQFGSWFNAYYQRTYKVSGGYDAAFAKEHKSAVAFELFVQPVLLGMMAAALTANLPGDDEESIVIKGQPVSLAEWTALQTGSQLTGMFPLIRDVYSAGIGFKNQGVLQAGTGAVSKSASDVMALFEVSDGDKTGVKLVSNAIKSVSTFTPIPGAGQVSRLLDFIDSDSQGKEEGSPFGKTYQAFVEGPDRNK